MEHWSVTQPTISLSSAEAEAKAITKGCVGGIYTNKLLEGLTGEPRKKEVWTDSSSAGAISQRLGLGLEIQQMFTQDT